MKLSVFVNGADEICVRHALHGKLAVFERVEDLVFGCEERGLAFADPSHDVDGPASAVVVLVTGGDARYSKLSLCSVRNDVDGIDAFARHGGRCGDGAYGFSVVE